MPTEKPKLGELNTTPSLDNSVAAEEKDKNINKKENHDFAFGNWQTTHPNRTFSN
ncbi:hypothetical protein [Aliikangiella maris]|uniref:Uncharacterized protein n=2 Tax=Aliikangiella maris TaxID=3162458 RepID=A0ABV2BWC5_9GAMM